MNRKLFVVFGLLAMMAFVVYASPTTLVPDEAPEPGETDFKAQTTTTTTTATTSAHSTEEPKNSAIVLTSPLAVVLSLLLALWIHLH